MTLCIDRQILELEMEMNVLVRTSVQKILREFKAVRQTQDHLTALHTNTFALGCPIASLTKNVGH
jgi:hypothetical protein